MTSSTGTTGARRPCGCGAARGETQPLTRERRQTGEPLYLRRSPLNTPTCSKLSDAPATTCQKQMTALLCTPQTINRNAALTDITFRPLTRSFNRSSLSRSKKNVNTQKMLKSDRSRVAARRLICFSSIRPLTMLLFTAELMQLVMQGRGSGGAWLRGRSRGAGKVRARNDITSATSLRVLTDNTLF